MMQEQLWILVRGAGDLATGVIVRLHRCGFRVAVTECANPSAIRRRAALCEAVWQGQTTVEGVTCRRVTGAEAARVSQAGEVPLLVDERAECVSALRPAAVERWHDVGWFEKRLGGDGPAQPVVLFPALDEEKIQECLCRYTAMLKMED